MNVTRNTLCIPFASVLNILSEMSVTRNIHCLPFALGGNDRVGFEYIIRNECYA